MTQVCCRIADQVRTWFKYITEYLGMGFFKSVYSKKYKMDDSFAQDVVSVIFQCFKSIIFIILLIIVLDYIFGVPS